MSEPLWRCENDPFVLLDDLYPQRTLGSVQHQTRKCRMYLLACARRQWDRLPDVCRVLVHLAEVVAAAPRAEEWLRARAAPVAERLMHSDGEESDLLTAHAELALADHIGSVDFNMAVREAHGGSAPPRPPLSPAEWHGLSVLVYLPFERETPSFRWVPAELHSADLLREVYYNPHAFVPFHPAWRTTDVLALAQQMYDAREFSAMPILADALQDAGCDDRTILDHCRKPPVDTHVRGCWVLDKVLDRR